MNKETPAKLEEALFLVVQRRFLVKGKPLSAPLALSRYIPTMSPVFNKEKD
jgi:hypothetical protein